MKDQGEQTEEHSGDHHTRPLIQLPCLSANKGAGGSTNEIAYHVYGIQSVVGIDPECEEAGLIHDMHRL